MLFNSESTEKAFMSWLTIGGGVNPNPQDNERFFVFARLYFENEESITQDAFVKAAKKLTHTSKRVNRGICQKYYRKLITIQDFLSSQRNNL